MCVVIMPGRLARGVNHIPAAGEVTGFRLTQFGTAASEIDAVYPNRVKLLIDVSDIYPAKCTQRHRRQR
jgi:hypothetical protein